MRTGRSQLIRDLNRALVLDIVRERRAVSRAEIARISGLSPSTVTTITASLVSDELLIEEPPAIDRHGVPASVGRPGTLLRVDPGARHVIGVKLAPESLTATVTDLDATPLAMITLPHAVHARPQHIGDLFETAVQQVLADAQLADADPLGIGIGVPGSVDPQSGAVSRSPLPDWAESDLVDVVEERLGMPVLVDNDVNTLTVAEHLFGSGRGLAQLLVISIGHGIGMGAVIDGSIVRGWRGAFGEIGHIEVEPEGEPCWCGRTGCLETVASEPAIVRDVLAATGSLVDPQDLPGLAMTDERVNGVLVEAGRLVGRAVATAVILIDPQRVIVSGEGVRLGPAHRRGIRLGMNQGLGPSDQLDVVFEQWGDEAWARGAASLVLRELFHPAHLRAAGPSTEARVTPRGDSQSRAAAVGQGGLR